MNLILKSYKKVSENLLEGEKLVPIEVKRYVGEEPFVSIGENGKYIEFGLNKNSCIFISGYYNNNNWNHKTLFEKLAYVVVEKQQDIIIEVVKMDRTIGNMTYKNSEVHLIDIKLM